MNQEFDAQKIGESPNSNFMNFFNTIKDLLFILDMEGNIQRVNQSVR